MYPSKNTVNRINVPLNKKVFIDSESLKYYQSNNDTVYWF